MFAIFLGDSGLIGRNAKKKLKQKNNDAIWMVRYDLITIFLFVSFVCSAYTFDCSRKKESVLREREKQKRKQ